MKTQAYESQMAMAPRYSSRIRIACVLMLPLFMLISGCEKTDLDDKGTEMKPIEPLKLQQGISKFASTCMVNLVAGQNLNVGSVIATFNDGGDELTIAYSIVPPGLGMISTNLDIQADPANFPMTGSGNPKPGQFAYGSALNAAITWEQVVDLHSIQGWTEGDTVFVAAKADVDVGSSGQEGAWGEGEEFPGDNWAMYFYCVPPPLWECGDILIDERDGQQYPTVLIGNQCWMARNLNVGTMIGTTYGGNTAHSDASNNGVIEKYCWNNDINMCNEFGGLYDWDEMMGYVTTSKAQGICPDGWHIPNYDEWGYLINTSLGGYAHAGGKLKEAGIVHWSSPNTGATNSSGFTAFGGGRRNFAGYWWYMGYTGFFWSSNYDYIHPERARTNVLFSYLDAISRETQLRQEGHSVRCIRNPN